MFPAAGKNLAFDRGKPPMTPLISAWIWLGFTLGTAEEPTPSRRPQPAFQIYADVKHTGILAGPLTTSSLAPNEFGVAVPLPAVSDGRDRWPEKLDADDQLVEHSGECELRQRKPRVTSSSP